MSPGRVWVDFSANAEKRKAGIALTQHPDTFEMTERLRKLKGAAVLGDDQGPGREEWSGAKKCEYAAVLVSGRVRRIEEDNVERWACCRVFRSEALQAAQGVELQDSCTAPDAEGIEVFLNEGGGRWVIFDEHGFDSATAERFDADGAGPCKDIKEAAAGDALGKNIKE